MEYTNKKGQAYFLHGMVVTLRGGNREQQIYYFSKTQNAERLVADLPAGYEVVENERTGLPVLKRVR